MYIYIVCKKAEIHNFKVMLQNFNKKFKHTKYWMRMRGHMAWTEINAFRKHISILFFCFFLTCFLTTKDIFPNIFFWIFYLLFLKTNKNKTKNHIFIFMASGYNLVKTRLASDDKTMLKNWFFFFPFYCASLKLY